MKITSPNYPDLECYLKSMDGTSDFLRMLKETLGIPVEQSEVWIKYDGGSEYCDDEQKYADFYPQFNLFVQTERAGKHNFIHIEKPLNDSFLNTKDTGWISELLDAIAETNDETSRFHEFHTNTQYIPKFIKECVIPVLGNNVVECTYEFNNKLVEYIYSMQHDRYRK